MGIQFDIIPLLIPVVGVSSEQVVRLKSLARTQSDEVQQGHLHKPDCT